ncbi:hypothetical protein IFM12275_06420 [Nocardia sputorum]|uniref:Uncharacterized protein n=1 Tax=Nocardia sputorum TaxID=2984338 RepID=A0ABM8CWB4_9NOCA|nr:hypothetical protein IFM12275_06420 [Nocardia sputorum]BDT99282.1 hypothetical protein IFM12276_23110 [Nocardia sputorum]
MSGGVEGVGSDDDTHPADSDDDAAIVSPAHNPRHQQVPFAFDCPESTPPTHGRRPGTIWSPQPFTFSSPADTGYDPSVRTTESDRGARTHR